MFHSLKIQTAADSFFFAIKNPTTQTHTHTRHISKTGHFPVSLPVDTVGMNNYHISLDVVCNSW